MNYHNLCGFRGIFDRFMGVFYLYKCYQSVYPSFKNRRIVCKFEDFDSYMNLTYFELLSYGYSYDEILSCYVCPPFFPLYSDPCSFGWLMLFYDFYCSMFDANDYTGYRRNNALVGFHPFSSDFWGASAFVLTGVPVWLPSSGDSVC